MIASLRGPVVAIAPDHAVIECGGVGYLFLATPSTLGSLRRGEEASVLTYLSVKEDSLTLFGFRSDDERRMFNTLQTVSGMGPKLALATVGTLGPADISVAIAQGDLKRMQTVPGVGKRMAERLAVELKDKVGEFAPAPAEIVTPVVPKAARDVATQVTEALIGLGFNDRIAGPVVDGVLAEHPEMDTSAALRASLSQLGKK